MNATAPASDGPPEAVQAQPHTSKDTAMTITNERLAEIQDRAHNATPGPWGVGNRTEIALDARQDGPGCFTYTVKLATGPVLCRAANTLVEWGHIKDDHIDNEDGGYDAAGAIADAAGLDPTDWDPCPVPPTCQGQPVYAEGEWERRRAAALAALRTLAGHLRPDLKPEAMSRREVVEWIGDWNDQPDRTAAQVVTAMRQAAREAVTSRG